MSIFFPPWIPKEIIGDGQTGTVISTFTKSGNESSCLDLNQPTGTQHGKVMRVLNPGDQTNMNPVTYIGNGGEIKTRAWLTVSGATTGNGDGYSISDPLDSGTYPQMLSVWADVPYSLTLRTYNANNGFNIVALDRNANFRFMMPEDGSLQFGPSTANTPSGIDTGIYRIGAGTIAVGNSTTGDFSGTIKVYTVDIPNQGVVTGRTSGNVAYNLLQVDSGNTIIFGSGTFPGNFVIFTPTNKEFRFLDRNGGKRIVSLQESSAKVCLGNNADFDGTVTIEDGTATSGDTTLCIRDGAARAGRVRFANSSGTYDVGLNRESAGLLALQDASTTLTNYRDLKLRTLYSGNNQVVSSRRTGWTAATGTATRSSFDTTTVTTSVLAEHVKALIDDLIAHGLIGA